MNKSKNKITLLHSNGYLIVPIQVELTEELINNTKIDIFNYIKKKYTKGLLIDVSSINIINSKIASSFIEISKVSNLLGVDMVLTGLKPGVVSSFVDLGINMYDISTALTLDDGYKILKSLNNKSKSDTQL